MEEQRVGHVKVAQGEPYTDPPKATPPEVAVPAMKTAALEPEQLHIRVGNLTIITPGVRPGALVKPSDLQVFIDGKMCPCKSLTVKLTTDAAPEISIEYFPHG